MQYILLIENFYCLFSQIISMSIIKDFSELLNLFIPWLCTSDKCFLMFSGNGLITSTISLIVLSGTNKAAAAGKNCLLSLSLTVFPKIVQVAKHIINTSVCSFKKCLLRGQFISL